MIQLSAIAFTLLAYLFLGIAFHGWGRVVELLLAISQQRPQTLVMRTWLGWACCLFILQAIHFFLPITAYVVVPLLSVGVIISIFQLRADIQRFLQQWGVSMFSLAVGLIFLGFAAWVASRAMLPATVYDSGLYHFNAIRWINTFSVVPGLGNLHGRLAFNQSFFIYVAALNFYPFFGYGRSLANSFLLLLAAVSVMPPIIGIIRRPALLLEKHPFLYVPSFSIIPLILYLALTSGGVSSPTPDLASILLQLVIFSILATGLAEWITGKRDMDYEAMFLVIMASTLITIKLSNLAFSLVVIAFPMAYAWQKADQWRRAMLRLLLPLMVVLSVWGIRGIVLSGAPLYPSTIGYVSVDWAVPVDKVIDEAHCIYGWAREPYVHWNTVLGGWAWFYPWLIRTSADVTGVVYPLLLTAGFFVLTQVTTRLMKDNHLQRLEWALLILPLVSLTYWFFTAPDPRFANAAFSISALSATLLFISSVRDVIRPQTFAVLLCAVFLIGNAHFLIYAFGHRWQFRCISNSGWHPTMVVPMETKTTESGLTVYVPKTGDQSWDAPLPSAPQFNARLRLRDSSNITSGFAVPR
jgi:hypothetical protein